VLWVGSEQPMRQSLAPVAAVALVLAGAASCAV
jgi:hypothetical protein